MLDLAHKLGYAARSGLAAGVVVAVLLPDGHTAGVMQAGEISREPGIAGKVATDILAQLSW